MTSSGRAGERGSGGAEETLALLTLLFTPGLSVRRVLLLLRECGSGVAAWRALRARCGEELARAAASAAVRERVRAALATLERLDAHVVSWLDAGYPELMRLRLGDEAPPVLFARGDLTLLGRTSVAIVGCRRATEYGLDVASMIAEGLAHAGVGVVSGLARGIDGAAHRAALQADGATIAVLGNGIDRAYPRAHRDMQEIIARDGLLLTEFPPGDPPLPGHFPFRNRIIAALSTAVVVVEATENSGSLKTAVHALDQDVPLFVVPNSIFEPTYRGIELLFRDGAEAFTGVQWLLERIGVLPLGAGLPKEQAKDVPPPGGPPLLIWNALGRGETLHTDTIAARAGLTAAQALPALLELELGGRIRQLPGRRFTRVRNRTHPGG